MKNAFLLMVALSLLTLNSCSSWRKGSGGDSSGQAGVFTDEDLTLEQKRWAEGANIPEAEAGNLFRDVHFDYDSSQLIGEERDVIQLNARALISDPSLRAEIEGHCDERGTTDYNYALGEQRAKSVSDLLISFGVDATQLSTISYGEEIPLQKGSDESAFAQNRRAHFALYRKK